MDNFTDVEIRNFGKRFASHMRFYFFLLLDIKSILLPLELLRAVNYNSDFYVNSCITKTLVRTFEHVPWAKEDQMIISV